MNCKCVHSLADSQCDQSLIASADNLGKFGNQFQGNLCKSFLQNSILKKLKDRTHSLVLFSFEFCISYLVFCISSFLSVSSLAGPALASWISGDYGNPLPPDWNWAKMCKTFPFHPFSCFKRQIAQLESLTMYNVQCKSLT